MGGGIRRVLPAIGLVAALAFGATGEAGAAQRFAAPNGSGLACSSASPCAITTAINNAGGGDEVIVRPGSYGSPVARIATNLQSSAEILLRGVSDKPRPRIYSQANFPLHLSDPGAVLRHLEIDARGGINVAALRFQGALAEDFVALGIDKGGCAVAGSGTLRNGVCQMIGGSTAGSALNVSAVLAPAPSVSVRNMTLIADVGRGLSATSVSGRPVQVTMVNSIARGGGAPPAVDVVALSQGDEDARILARHDNFETTATAVQGGTTGSAEIQGDGTNQTAAPLLVNPLAGDYRQRRASPTVDAGLNSPLNGSADLDGQPRRMRIRTDIGADELPDSCGGRLATVIGGPGNDVLTGTPGPDVFFGGRGNDVFRGFGGNDIACGGPGRDRLFGGRGRDLLFGGAGRDRLFGGGGPDRIFGGSGGDRLFGGRGRDRLFGGGGPDRIFGGPGRDRLFGGPGRDRLFGGPGRDRLFGGPGRDLVRQ